MKRKIVSLILLIVILLGVMPITYAETSNNIELTVDKSTVNVGDTVTVTLKTSQKVEAVDFSINYSNEIFEFVSSNASPKGDNQMYEVKEKENSIQISAINPDGGFDTFTFVFKAKAKGNSKFSTNIEKLNIDTTNNSLSFKNESIDVTAQVEVVSIALDKTVVSIKTGKTETLTATVTPTNATNKTVTWTSSDESIATVSNGTVKGIKAGTTTITAEIEGKTATCEITVLENDDYYIKNKNFTLIQGNETLMLTGIEENTTLEQLISEENFSSDYTIKTYKDGKQVDTGIVTTGTVIKIFDGTELVREYTVIIYGDTSGDGLIEALDALKIVQNSLDKIKFENELYLQAGRVTEKTRSSNSKPSAVDALAVIKHKLNKEKISQQ